MLETRSATVATLVALILISLTLSACNRADPAPGDPLDGTSWVLVAYRKSRPLPGTTITVTFEDGQVRGAAGCNTYNGSYRVSGDTITVGSVAITELACMEPEGVMEQERQYVQYITGAQTFRLTDGQLQVFWTDHEALTFEPRE